MSIDLALELSPQPLALTPEQLEISPGVGAFVAFFVLAIAMVLLVLNMSKHLRRVDRHRIEDEVRAEFEAEQEGKRQSANTGVELPEEPQAAASNEEPPPGEGDTADGPSREE